MTEVQYLRNPRTREHHQILLIDGGRLSEERCNLDDAGEMEAESYERAAESVVEGESWCGQCCGDQLTFTTDNRNRPAEAPF